MEQRTAVIIVAGGSGTRCGGTLPKQFRLLGNRPVLARTIDLFASAIHGTEIVVVLPARHIDFWNDFSARFEVAPHKVVAGGEERFHSVRNGLAALCTKPDLVAIHDAVRPFATPEMIRCVVDAAAESGAAIPTVVPVDSFRKVGDAGSQPVDRNRLRIVQTPQVFRADWLTKAYGAEYDPRFTDDATVVEAAGHPVRLVAGDDGNIKLTTETDFDLAEALLAVRAAKEDEEQTAATELHAQEVPQHGR